MTLQLGFYKATESDILDAISERVLEDAEAIESLTRSLQEHWFLRIPNASRETLRWYTVTVVTNFVDGGRQPFDSATTKSVLRNAPLETWSVCVSYEIQTSVHFRNYMAGNANECDEGIKDNTSARRTETGNQSS